jgi:hypothetical protein
MSFCCSTYLSSGVIADLLSLLGHTPKQLAMVGTGQGLHMEYITSESAATSGMSIEKEEGEAAAAPKK